MREILFKAKRKDNGKWVEGHYYKMSETTYCFKEDYERNPVQEHHYILQERMTDWGLPNQVVQIEIDPETLCQFTGLCDKNGNKIWENDILMAHLDDDYPEDVKILATNKDGSIFAHVPIKYVKLRAPRKLTEEQREKLIERGKNISRNKAIDCEETSDLDSDDEYEEMFTF